MQSAVCSMMLLPSSTPLYTSSASTAVTEILFLSNAPVISAPMIMRARACFHTRKSVNNFINNKNKFNDRMKISACAHTTRKAKL